MLVFPVAAITAGGILTYAGINGVSVLDVIKGIAKPGGAGKSGNPFDQALAKFGGIGGQGVSGGVLTGAAALGTPGGGSPGGIYTKANLGRTDMGVDFTGSGPVPALADGVIVRASPQGSGTGWPGAGDGGTGNNGALIVEQIGGGRFIYYAENMDPHVSVGQHVRRGQTIATARGQFPYTETGWASDSSGTTLSVAHHTQGLKDSGNGTPEGQDFKRWLGF